MQSTLSSHFLRQDIINKLLAAGEEDSSEVGRYANRLLEIAHIEDSEHSGLADPFDRSVAIVFELFRDEDLDPWNVDLSQFLKLFGKRITDGSNDLDLPACGRLIRLAWEVLHGQAANLLDRVLRDEEEEFDDPFIDWGWEMEYDDAEFSFTTNVLTGEAENELPKLFNERIRREEGRQVTLGELLSALKGACDDADDLKMRDENRIRYAKEVEKALKNVGSRMHKEDIDGDILRCWKAMKKVAVKNGRSPGEDIPVEEVIAQLRSDLLAEYGAEVKNLDDEADITTFISSLFLTHRGLAEVQQKQVPHGRVTLRDKWPEINDHQQIINLINEQKNLLSEQMNVKDGGKEQHLKRMVERAAEVERKQAEAERKQTEAKEKTSKAESVEGPHIEITLPAQLEDLQ